MSSRTDKKKYRRLYAELLRMKGKIFYMKYARILTTSDVTAFLTRLTMKPLTVKKVKIVFHSIMKYAVSQKFIASNPCGGAVWQEVTEQEFGEIENVLNLQQAQKLLQLLEDYSPFNTIIKLLLLSGMRSGECLGLRWSSIDLERKTIFIDKTLSYANNTWFLTSPKTSRSTRTICIDDTALRSYDSTRRNRISRKRSLERRGSIPSSSLQAVRDIGTTVAF